VRKKKALWENTSVRAVRGEKEPIRPQPGETPKRGNEKNQVANGRTLIRQKGDREY